MKTFLAGVLMMVVGVAGKLFSPYMALLWIPLLGLGFVVTLVGFVIWAKS